MDLLFRKYTILTILIICASLTTACGKKPSDIKAPPHVTHDSYPQTYPPKQPVPGQ